MMRGIIYTGVFCAVCMMASPGGRVRDALRIACACAMCIAVLSAVKQIDLDKYAEAVSAYNAEAEEYASLGEEYSKNENKSVIESAAEAYISDKAELMGVDVSAVEVTAEWSDEGYWYPYKAVITSDAPEDKLKALEDTIKEDLGIEQQFRQ